MSIRRSDVPGKRSPKGRFQVIQLGKESSWDIGELHISAKLERPATAREIAEHIDRDQPPSDAGDKDLASEDRDLASDLVLRSSAHWADAWAHLAIWFLDDAWTAAQVVATTITLGAAISSGARKWRQRSLPKGSRLTLTITPDKHHDHRRPVHIMINDINTKSESEITDEIREALLAYTRERKKIDQLNIPKQPAQLKATKRNLTKSEYQKIGRSKHAKSRRKRSRRKH